MTRKEFIAGAASAVLAVDSAYATGKEKKMMKKIDCTEFVLKPFTQFDKGWFLFTAE